MSTEENKAVVRRFKSPPLQTDLGPWQPLPPQREHRPGL